MNSDLDTASLDFDRGATSYHEAGHAVAGFLLGCPVTRAVLSSAKEGHCELPPMARTPFAILQRMQVVLAGEIGVVAFWGLQSGEGEGTDDHALAQAYASDLASTPEEADQLVDWATTLTWTLVRSHKFERLAGALASALLEHGELSGDLVAELLERTARIYAMGG